jgi:hypothetical protein
VLDEERKAFWQAGKLFYRELLRRYLEGFNLL